MGRGHSVAATAQLYLGLDVRVFWPLAKLGPLRALTASVRALSETLTGNAVAAGHDGKAWRQRPSFTLGFRVLGFP